MENFEDVKEALASQTTESEWESDDSNTDSDTETSSSDDEPSNDEPSDDEAEVKPEPKPERVCSACKKAETQLPIALKRCAKCHTQLYCSRACQTSDWKVHKKSCGKPFNDKPKLCLDVSDTMLHNLSEKEVYTHLIDAYRLRVEDEYVLTGDVSMYSLYGGAKPLPHFRQFLKQAEKRQGLLPAWWSQAKRRECEKLAVDEKQWSDINSAVEKSDIVEHYGNPFMPMKLRVLAEKVYGKGISRF